MPRNFASVNADNARNGPLIGNERVMSPPDATIEMMSAAVVPSPPLRGTEVIPGTELMPGWVTGRCQKLSHTPAAPLRVGGDTKNDAGPCTTSGGLPYRS